MADDEQRVEPDPAPRDPAEATDTAAEATREAARAHDHESIEKHSQAERAAGREGGS